MALQVAAPFLPEKRREGLVEEGAVKLLNATERRLGISWRDVAKQIHRVSFHPGINTVDDALFDAVSRNATFKGWVKKRWLVVQGEEDVLAAPITPARKRATLGRAQRLASKAARKAEKAATELGLDMGNAAALAEGAEDGE